MAAMAPGTRFLVPVLYHTSIIGPNDRKI